MTCEEFRRLAESPLNIIEATRAERSAMRNHYCDCQKCYAYMQQQSFLYKITLSQPEKEVVYQRISVIIARDLQDPEF